MRCAAAMSLMDPDRGGINRVRVQVGPVSGGQRGPGAASLLDRTLTRGRTIIQFGRSPSTDPVPTCRSRPVPVGFEDHPAPRFGPSRAHTRRADKENPVSGRRAQQVLSPYVLRWARERASLAPEELAAKMRVKPDRLRDWESSGRISLAQVDGVAHHTRTPLGYLFLKAPPKEDLVIPDYRTFAGSVPSRPSPDLLETVHQMRRRQTWLRDELIEAGADPLSFVGSCRDEPSSDAVAEAMRGAFSLPAAWAAAQSDWTAALRHLRERADAAGVITVFNGIVGNNTSRKLDRSEFQGFALVDSHAPLVFVNAADFRTAQMFTLAHELAHLFVGAPGVSSLGGLLPAP